MTVDFVLVSFQDRGASRRIRRQLERTVRCPYTLTVVSNTRRNLGWAAACNKGALGGEGELIGFLNQDLELQPDWFEPVIEALRGDPRLAIAGPRCLDGGAWPRLPAGLEQWVCGACMLVRRDFFEQIGGFDSERFPHEYAETDLARTAVARGYAVRTIERAQVVHHYSPNKSQQVLGWRAQGARNEAEKWGIPVDRWGVGDEPPSVCLCMIVRNEAAWIERCIASAAPLIDRWVIVDTGSVDDTAEKLTRALDGIPGQLHRRPWVSSRHNRTELMELAFHKGDYLLLLDAAGAVQGTIPPGLTADCYLVKHVGERELYKPVLVSGRRHWRFEGAEHEYITADEPCSRATLDMLVIDSQVAGGSRSGSKMEARPTICLSMIVRDEAHVVRETLDSVAPHIDYWVIVDTGSTDATIETIRSHMAARGLPGEIHERPWCDFGVNRTEALRLCDGKADYSWVIDADDLVVGDLDLSGLRADSYLLRYGDDFRYWRKQIFRDGLGWRYEGVVHESPRCPGPATEERLQGAYHIDRRLLGARSRAVDKYERDARLLRKAVERNPDDARSVFYLAQSYYDAGDHAQALEWYGRRAEMGGWAEEIFYSLLRRAACLIQLGEPAELGLAAYMEAWQARPTRAEPLYEIARHYRSAKRFNLGYLFAKRAAELPLPQEDVLFLAADVYSWRAVDEQAVCAYHCGRPEECFELYTALLEGSSLPESERARVKANLASCVPWFDEPRREYPAESLAGPFRRQSGKGAEVAIYAGPGWERWHPIEITTRGLGGSETAAYRLAESLSELGYEVTLYGDCEPGAIGKVMVRDWRTFDPARPRLALISSRRPEIFDGEIAAERRLLWLHDVDAGDGLTPVRAEQIDRILCLSSWHRAHLAERYPFAKGKLVRIRNGITSSYFTTEPAPEREKRVLYTSSPDRGLDILLQLWPSVRKRVPDAELVHVCAPVYDRIADRIPSVRAHREAIRELAAQPGVCGLSGLAQPDLIELMRSSLVWAHPAFITPCGARMMETSCIGAMEAQAAGCCVVAAGWGALPETVKVGTLIDGDPMGSAFRETFADAIVAGLTDEDVQTNAQTDGPAVALGWGWDGVAEMVAALVEPALAAR